MGALFELWIAIHPIRRIREAHAAKRAAENQVSENVPVEAAPAAEGEGMSELGKSMLRSLLKVFGAAVVTWAVSKGFVGTDQTDALAGALESIAGALAVIGGVWWSHRTHKA